MSEERHESITQRIVEVFLKGNLSVLLIVISLIAGAVALMVTPREEEPQIVVPLADIIVNVPGASASEVEKHVSTRLEKLLYQIDGVEYVYSMSRPNTAIVTVRFYVGQDREASLVKIYNKINSNIDMVPLSVAGWVVKPIEIDDVPIVNVTLWSSRPGLYDDSALRRIAEEMETSLQGVKNTNKVYVVGGRPRTVRVELDSQAMAAHDVTPLEIEKALKAADASLTAGDYSQQNKVWRVEAGKWLRDSAEVGNLVVRVSEDRPVYLSNVARVIDGPDEVESYTWLGFGPEGKEAVAGSPLYPAVHIAVAKQKGANAVWVAKDVEARVTQLEKTLLPPGIQAKITRNYGETANEKVNELVEGLSIAVLIVIGLIALTLGWKEALIVTVAVPITFSLTLLVNYLFGYTINRVTLFALTLALGLVVDNPIVDVENIYRHFKMRAETPFRAVLTAVNEVRPPIILATLAVIISFLPMFFITGMMGPYMRPMALNVPLAMLMSLVVAFTITPWMSYHILRPRKGETVAHEEYVLEKTFTYRAYSRILRAFLHSRVLARALLIVTFALFCFAIWLAAARLVPLKMLPFDNKNEFQIVVDMPEGTTLESTDEALRAMATALRRAPEVVNFSLYSGLASPMDFNGLVRHYYLRHGANVGDIRVNLVPKAQRQQQSHEIVLRLRNELQRIARKHNANIKLVEMPPGPPVISTITAEINGGPNLRYDQLIAGAKAARARLEKEPLVVDVDDTVEDDMVKIVFETDKEKAAIAGISTDAIARTVRLALSGSTVATIHDPFEAYPLRIVLRLPRSSRSAIEDLQSLPVKGDSGAILPLGSLGKWTETIEDKTIYHKNLERVVYVFAEVAGRAPADAIVDIQADQEKQGKTAQAAAAKPRPLKDRTFYRNGGGTPWRVPEGVKVNWAGEGEWKITLDVFRDLGIAFAAACLGIYVLLVYQTGSYFMPLILMISIPLTMIGIMPGFWLLDLLGNHPVGGFPNPTFFTATAMIGMIALSGIAVRNAILLIEFVHEALRKGEPLETSLVNSGAVRFRPIVLTSAAAMLAAWPITLDPHLLRPRMGAHLRPLRLHSLHAHDHSRGLRSGLQKQTRPWPGDRGSGRVACCAEKANAALPIGSSIPEKRARTDASGSAQALQPSRPILSIMSILSTNSMSTKSISSFRVFSFFPRTSPNPASTSPQSQFPPPPASVHPGSSRWPWLPRS